jgi:hypothetical protein
VTCDNCHRESVITHSLNQLKSILDEVEEGQEKEAAMSSLLNLEGAMSLAALDECECRR